MAVNTVPKNMAVRGLFAVFNHVQVKASGGPSLVIRLISIISFGEKGGCPVLPLTCDRNKSCFCHPEWNNELLLPSCWGLHHHANICVRQGDGIHLYIYSCFAAHWKHLLNTQHVAMRSSWPDLCLGISPKYHSAGSNKKYEQAPNKWQ